MPTLRQLCLNETFFDAGGSTFCNDDISAKRDLNGSALKYKTWST